MYDGTGNAKYIHTHASQGDYMYGGQGLTFGYTHYGKKPDETLKIDGSLFATYVLSPRRKLRFSYIHPALSPFEHGCIRRMTSQPNRGMSYCTDKRGAAMTASFLSSRDFNRDPGRAKRAAKNGPVFVTERSKPALVVLSIEDYEKLAGQHRSLADLLMPPDNLDFEFDAAKAMPGFKPADID